MPLPEFFCIAKRVRVLIRKKYYPNGKEVEFGITSKEEMRELNEF